MELGPPLEGWGGGGSGLRNFVSVPVRLHRLEIPSYWSTKAAAAVESSSKCQKFYPVLYGYNM